MKEWSAIAACLALAVYAGSRLIPTGISEPNVSTGTGDLPMLTITSEAGGMGFEGLMAYDISELGDGNPWTEDTRLNTLPVYENTDSSGTAKAGIGKEHMLELAERAANLLGMEITNITYDVNEKSGYKSDTSLSDKDDIYRVIAETATTKIAVTRGGTVTITFNGGLELPLKYNFTYSGTTEKEAESAINYMQERYAALISFTNPQKALFADYDFDGNLHRSYYTYDMTGDIIEQILNFNFNKVQFAPDDDGNLMLIRINNGLSCARKLGDYPIITSEEAFQLLLSKNYVTSVPEEMPGEEYVAKVKLVYRTDNANVIFMPYYRFLVELPDMQQKNRLKTYGAYYVPAVQQQYISNMPLWDGTFNN